MGYEDSFGDGLRKSVYKNWAKSELAQQSGQEGVWNWLANQGWDTAAAVGDLSLRSRLPGTTPYDERYRLMDDEVARRKAGSVHSPNGWFGLLQDGELKGK